MKHIKPYNKKTGSGKIAFLYFFHIAQVLLLTLFSRDDFIPENIKKLKIIVQAIITKINEASVILKTIF